LLTALTHSLISLTHALTRQLMHHNIADDYIERATRMTTDKLAAVSQDRDSSDGMATRQVSIP